MMQSRASFVVAVALCLLLVVLPPCEICAFALSNETANIIVDFTSGSSSEEPAANTTSRAMKQPLRRASLVAHNDAYIARNQKLCFDSRNLVSCVKYKASKLIWKLATNGLGYFPNEYSRELGEDKRRIRLIQLGEPADDISVFNDAKSLEGDNELVHIFKFMKRAVETFGRNHALQLSLNSDTGARVVSDIEARSRHERKKRKWLIILPLIILMKIAHLKMTVVTLLLGVLGMNVLLVGGTGWLIHYLKFKTLCKIHPHMVQTHSHVYDSDPTDYSQFVGSSFPTSYYGSGGSSPHEISVNGYSKDWAQSKAYHSYGNLNSNHNHNSNNNNYLDTISKRLQ